MGQMLSSRRRDFGDVGAAAKVPPKKPAADAFALKMSATPWYKSPLTWGFVGVVALLMFGPSLLTHGGRARHPRPFDG